MGRNIKFVTVFAVLVGIFAVLEKGDAATYVVGDSLGWTIPSGGASTYATWASQHVFRTGDVLVFNFATGIHDVATVTRAAFDGCSPSNPISLITLGPANVTLGSPGEAYYICTFGQHCTAGQKLAINVSAASTPAPRPTPAAPVPAPGITPPAAPVPAPRIPPPGVPAPAPAPTPNITPPGAPAPAPTPTGGTSPAPSPASTQAPAPGGGATPPSPPAPPGALTPGSSPPPAENVSPPSPPNSSATRAIATSFVVFASIAMAAAF